MGYKFGYKASFGSGNTFSNDADERTVQVGYNNTTYSDDSFTAGRTNLVSGSHSCVAMGTGNTVEVYSGIALGNNNTVNEAATNGGVAIGSGNTVKGIASTGMGEGNTVGEGGLSTNGRAAFCAGRVSTTLSSYSFGVGYGHSVSGASTGTAALGLLNIADENSYCSTLLGYGAKSSRYGEIVHAATAFSATGDAQVCHIISKNQTTDGAATELFTNGSDKRITIPANTNGTFSILIIGRQTNGSGEGGSYKVEGGIKNEGGTTALIGAGVTKTALAEDVAGWDVAVTADNTNDSIKIEVTGAVGDNVNWVAHTTLVQTTG